MKRTVRRVALAALLTTAALLLCVAIGADIIPVFNARTPMYPWYEWSYTLKVQNGTRINTGDYFTIYDFGLPIPGSEFAPADWSISEQEFGITPDGVDPGYWRGDYSLPNITFTYTGAASIFGPSIVGGVGYFGAMTSWGMDIWVGGYAASAHKGGPKSPDDGIVLSNGGFTKVPILTPEPSSFVLLAYGLFPLGVVLRRRRRS